MAGADHPVDELLRCHEEIMRQTEKLEEALSSYEKDGDRESLRLTLDVFLLFMKTTLRIHTRDEEEALFPCLRELDVEEGEMKEFLKEHDEFKATEEFMSLIKDMGSGDIRERLRKTIESLRSHAEREESILFGAAREMLSEEQLKRIRESMAGFRKPAS